MYKKKLEKRFLYIKLMYQITLIIITLNILNNIITINQLIESFSA